MTKVLIWSVVLATTLFFSGCASKQPQIEKASESRSLFNGAPIADHDHFVIHEEISGELYRVSAQKSATLATTQKIRHNVEKRANNFCEKENIDHQMLVVSECSAKPPYTAENSPKLEILFICIEKGQEYTKFYNEKMKYQQVVDLKILLNGETLTLSQFEIERDRVLQESNTLEYKVLVTK